MAKAGQRKCMSCASFFLPDARSAGRQRYCSAAECRRASKAASQAAWLAQPNNQDYFSGPVHVARVQAWRAAHPGYGRGKARAAPALQDPLPPQVPDVIEEFVDRDAASPVAEPLALQDLLNTPTPLLAGLVAHLFQPALQEDMVSTTRRLIQLGRDLINGGCGEGEQAAVAARAGAPDPGAVQLG